MSTGKMAYSDRCRCCLEKGRLRKMWDAYNMRENEQEIYGEMMTNCFALDWKRPQHTELICELCVARLRNAFSFKKQVLASEQLLLEELEEDEDVKPDTDQVDQDMIFEENIVVDKFDYSIQEELQAEYLDEDTLEEEILLSERDTTEIVETAVSGDIETEIMHEEFLDEEFLGPIENNDELKKTLWKMRNYTREDLENCLEAVKSNRLSVTAASHEYNVPRQTIRNKLRKEKLGITTTGSKIKTKPSDRVIAEKLLKDLIVTEETQKKPQRQILLKPVVRMLYDRNDEKKKHLHNLRTIMFCTNATPIKNRGDGGYRCCFCSNQYMNPADLKQHTIQDHDKPTKLKFMSQIELNSFCVKLDISDSYCILCNTSINSLEQIIEHLDTVHNKEMFTDIKNYIIPFKFEGEDLKCFMCGVKFNYFKSLRQHMSTHYRNSECDKCGLFFINSRSLASHNRLHESGEYPCQYCSKVFEVKLKRAAHERVVHQLKRLSVTCSFCGQRFRDVVKKTKHLFEVHGIEPPVFKCHACDKTFKLQRTYSKHIKSFHLNMKRFKCPICEKEFYERRSYRKHVEAHTGNKKYECELCEKWYGTQSSYDLHMRIHYDDCKYECEICDQRFVQKVAFRNHMRKKHNAVV